MEEKGKILRLPVKPPEPSHKEFYIQLDWLVERFNRRFDNRETRKGYTSAIRAYKEFLTCRNGYDDRLSNHPEYF